ncbi:MAG: hypothetical protein Q7T18_09350 [Sedimentisphaerales bacterium]|nr:hypothetical protein [Sedimentisphaerales bacterium]
MPIYCFRRADNHELVELAMSIAELDRRQKPSGQIVLDDGTAAFRDLMAEHGGRRHTPGNWPMCSDAAGVAAHQVGEAVAHSRQIGIPTDFTEDGRAIFTSPGHRKRYCEAIGLYDRNGGYGDPQRKGTLR